MQYETKGAFWFYLRRTGAGGEDEGEIKEKYQRRRRKGREKNTKAKKKKRMKNWVGKQKSKSERRLLTLVGNNPWFQFQLIETKLETRLISKART
jgi:hypothetical protein